MQHSAYQPLHGESYATLKVPLESSVCDLMELDEAKTHLASYMKNYTFRLIQALVTPSALKIINQYELVNKTRKERGIFSLLYKQDCKGSRPAIFSRNGE